MIQGQKIDSCGISSTTTAQKKTCLLSETLFFFILRRLLGMFVGYLIFCVALI